MKSLAQLYQNMMDRVEFQPFRQIGWFFEDVSGSTVIDLDQSFFFYLHITEDSTIKFKNGKKGYIYLILLKVDSGVNITWANNPASGNDTGVYIRFASGTKYEGNNLESADYVYLGGVLTEKDDDNLYLDFIAMANNLEEVEE